MVLLVAAGVFSVVNPGVLVAVPLALMILVLPARGPWALVVGLLAAFLAFGGDSSSGIWFVERGWALLVGGWFVALTLRHPGRGFLPRGLVAVGGSYVAMALLFWIRPGDWLVLDWAVTSRMARLQR